MLRKLKKSLKAVIILFLAFFIISVFLIGAGSVDWSRLGKNYVFKLNGVKVKHQKLALVQNMYRNYYDNIVNQEMMRLSQDIEAESKLEMIRYDYFEKFAFNNLIQNEIILAEAKKEKIKVTKEEIDTEFQARFAGISKSPNYKQFLNYNRLTVKNLKENAKEAAIIKKYLENLENKYEPTEAEIKAFFEENKYSKYADKNYEDIKNEIKEEYKKNNKYYYSQKYISDKLDKAEIEVINEYTELMYTDIVDIDGIKISEIEFYNSIISKVLYHYTPSRNEKEIYIETLEEYKEKVAIYNEALSRNLNVNKNLMKEAQFMNAAKELKKDLALKVDINESELKEYFEKNKERYEQKETADVKLIYIELKPSEKDKEVKNMQREVKASHILIKTNEKMKESEKKDMKKKAETILAKAKEADFAELAKEYSEDIGSGADGGNLGFFGKGRMVKPFEDAAFNGKVGEVYPELVETQFGYHIIKVTEDKEVEMPPVAGIETKAELKSKAENILSEAKAEGANYDELVKKYSELSNKEEIKNIRNTGYISQQVGFNKPLSEAIFSMKEGEIKLVETDKGNYIVKMTKYAPFKEADFTVAKDRVEFDLRDTKAIEKYEELKKELIKKVKVEILISKAKEIIELKK